MGQESEKYVYMPWLVRKQGPTSVSHVLSLDGLWGSPGPGSVWVVPNLPNRGWWWCSPQVLFLEVGDRNLHGISESVQILSVVDHCRGGAVVWAGAQGCIWGSCWSDYAGVCGGEGGLPLRMGQGWGAGCLDIRDLMVCPPHI